MNVALSQLEDAKGLQKDERKSKKFHNLLLMVKWHSKLEHVQEAMSYYQEALRLDYDKDEVSSCIIKSLVTTGQDRELQHALSDMVGRKSPSSNTDQLIAIFQHLIEDPDYELYFEEILTATSGTDIFEQLVEHMRIGYEIAEEERHFVRQAVFMLYYGLARYRYDTSAFKNPAVAKDIWEQCSELSKKDRKSPKLTEVCERSVVWLALFHYQAGASSMDPYHVRSLESIAETNGNNTFGCYDHKIYLACYYAHFVKDKEKARRALLKKIRDALDWLSDDEEWNDDNGYFILGDVFTHTGDDLDALSAWSMLRPKDAGIRHLNKSPEAKGRADWYISCDGMCGATWQYADDFHCCKLCSSQLCNGCLAKIKDGTIRRFVCSADHEWLHIPPWDDNEYLKVGPKNVLIGGELVNGARVGGRVVSLEEWLNIIRDDWNIPRAQEKESENDGPVRDLATDPN